MDVDPPVPVPNRPVTLTRTGRRLDWRPDVRDHSARLYALPASHAAGELPILVDLRPQCPAVYDQAQEGSCTGNALAGMFQYLNMRHDHHWKDIIPSRQFLYWNERNIEGSVGEDAGAALEDGIAVLLKIGVCNETAWPYLQSNMFTRPDADAFGKAAYHKLGKAQAIDNTQVVQVKSALASGQPVVIGFNVYESFESRAVEATGVVPMPQPGEAEIGGHAVLIVGYNVIRKLFIVRNSWGVGWGMKGYFTVPFAYFTDGSLANSAWTGNLTTVSMEREFV